jgi:hypothetical protein
MPKHTLVVARYKESLSWIAQVPKSFRVVVYNKGKSYRLRRRLLWPHWRVSLTALENTGREAETYLRHMLDRPIVGASDGFTVFCQGDPFEHSPDFLELLETTSQWKPVQPLSYRYQEEPAIPPAHILSADCPDFISGLRVRTATFSADTLALMEFHDPGVSVIIDTYREENGLGMDTNLSQHFLERCGLPALARLAEANHVGRFSYGAIFGVANPVLAELPVDTVRQMHRVSTIGIAPYFFERFWLHILGEPLLPPDQARASIGA